MHLPHEQLQELLSTSNVGLLYVEPTEYRKFAMPFKLFEYMGHGLPIIATKGAAIGDFVAEHDIGWVVSYGTDEIGRLLKTLSSKRGEIAAKRENIRRILPDHTWEARVRQVVSDMTTRPK